MAESETLYGLGLDVQRIHTMYYYMVLSRALDERMWILNRQGKSAFVVSCQGQEGAQAGVAMALDPAVDWVAPYYRDLVVVLAFGMTPREVMLGQLARAEDPNSGGRQMPAHYGYRRRHILTGSSPVATQVPHAAGLALAMKVRRELAVTAVFLGEGSINQGEFHEGLNFAAVHRLPLIVVVENNGYAISVPQSKAMAVQDVAARAEGYGVPGIVIQGSDPLAVFQATHEARMRALNGEGPTLIETKTHRFTPHSSDDDDRAYRTAEQLAQEKQDDALYLMRRWMIEQQLWDEERDARLQERVRAEVDDATEYAEKAPLPEPGTLWDHVYCSSPKDYSKGANTFDQ